MARNLAARIRVLCERSGLSKAEIARRMKPPVSDVAVGQWISGETKPTYDNLAGLARVLRVGIRSFFPDEHGDYPEDAAALAGEG